MSADLISKEIMDKVEQWEGWRAAHEDAKVCSDVERSIRELLAVLDEVLNSELQARRAIYRLTSPAHSDSLKAINDLLARIYRLMPSFGWYAYVFRNKGYEVRHLEELEKKFLDLHFLLMPNSDFFSQGDISELAGGAALHYLGSRSRSDGNVPGMRV